MPRCEAYSIGLCIIDMLKMETNEENQQVCFILISARQRSQELIILAACFFSVEGI